MTAQALARCEQGRSIVKNKDLNSKLLRRRRSTQAANAFAFVMLAGLVAGSAIVTKEGVSRSGLAPLAAIERQSSTDTAPAATPVVAPADLSQIHHTDTVGEIRDPLVAAEPIEPKVEQPKVEQKVTIEESPVEYAESTQIRYFNGRAVRPSRTITMTVTAYSPDSQSCGDSADGITSSIHSVWTNAMKLVAADSAVLPLGSLVSVPGYDSGNIVPVLDRGGAIKGNRMDVLYPTHETALKWGVQKLKVTVWEFADGSGPCDFRAIRDSRH